MKIIVRLMAMLVVVPATYFFIFWITLACFSLLIEALWIPNGISVETLWIPSSISLLCALLCAIGVGWFVWKKLGSTPTGLISSGLFGAVVLGAIGFCAGFFGPGIFDPGTTQGPLLGFFVTGPLGFLLGGISGIIYWLVTSQRKKSD